MKSSIALMTVGAAFAAAQSLSSLPACGQTCIQNMLALAPSLGCPTTNGVNATCLCENPDFGFGVRDCSNSVCSSSAQAQQVIQYGVAYCSSALGANAGSTATGTAGAGTGTATGTGGSGTGTAGAGTGGAGSSVPIATNTLSSGGQATGTTTLYGAPVLVPISTMTESNSGGKATGTSTLYSTGTPTAITTSTEKSGGKATGTTTIYGLNGKPTNVQAGAGASAKSSANSAVSSANSAKSSAQSAASSATGSSGSSSSGGSGGSGATSSSGGAAVPMRTAAPGLIGAAALALLAL